MIAENYASAGFVSTADHDITGVKCKKQSFRAAGPLRETTSTNPEKHPPSTLVFTPN
jgi:hypothetical protein